MSNPLVSVIIPAHNCEQFIRGSIQSALNQTVTNLEVLVIDDASTDNSYAILSQIATQDSRVLLYQNTTNMGVANTRNRGIDLAQGQYVAFLDADDLWKPQKLEKQLVLMESTGCDFCYTAYSFIDGNGVAFGKPYWVPAFVTFKQLIQENIIGCSTAICKAKLLKQYKMHPEYAHEDYVLWLELLQNGYTGCGVQETLMQYRVLKNSRSGDKKKAAVNRWRIYRNFLKMDLRAASIAFLSYAIRGIRKYYSPDCAKTPYEE